MSEMQTGFKVPRVKYELVVRDSEGNLKWTEDFTNLVTTEGMNDLLSKYFKGAAYTASFYVGLKGVGSEVIGDTAASHPTWGEVTAYSESTRQALTLGSVAAASVDNSGAPATFTINGNTTIAGAFISTSGVKSGTSGVLYSVGDFASSRTLASGDSVAVTCTLTAA